MKIVLYCFLLSFFTCTEKNDYIRSYKSKKRSFEKPLEQQAGPSFHFGWVLPKGWKEKGLTGIRLGSFAIGDAGDVSIITIPGAAGGDLANINRWRSQLALGPIQEDELEKVIQKSKGKLGAFSWAELNNHESKRSMLVAFFFYKGESIFVKLTSPKDLIGQQKENFLTFVRGLYVK